MLVVKEMGIPAADFFRAMQSFTGAGKRLQKVIDVNTFVMYKDFAHSPSKLKATTQAVKQQFPGKKVIACMELHTFSSLKKEFLPHYNGAMAAADCALVYFNPQVVAHKKLAMITMDDVLEGFGGGVYVSNETADVLNFINQHVHEHCVLLMMSSGNFDGIDFDQLGAGLAARLSGPK